LIDLFSASNKQMATMVILVNAKYENTEITGGRQLTKKKENGKFCFVNFVSFSCLQIRNGVIHRLLQQTA